MALIQHTPLPPEIYCNKNQPTALFLIDRLVCKYSIFLRFIKKNYTLGPEGLALGCHWKGLSTTRLVMETGYSTQGSGASITRYRFAVS